MAADAQGIRWGQAFVEIGANLDPLRKALDNARKDIKKIGDDLFSAGKTLMGAGLALAAPLAIGLKQFATYEQALADLKAFANPTAAEFENLKEQIEAVALATGTAPADVTAVYTELIKTGKTASEVLGGLGEAVVKFARVGSMTMGEASTTIVDALNVFTRDGLTATKAMNIISASADSSSISIKQVSEAFATGGASMALYGQSMRDSAVAIGILGNNAIKGSDAGTALKVLLSRMASGAETAGAAMAEMGLNVRDAQGNMLPLPEILKKISDATKGMNPADRDRLFHDLAGERGIKALAILTTQGVDGWNRFSEAMNNNLTVERKFAIMTDTLQEHMKRLWVQIQMVAITVGEALAPTVRDIGTVLQAVFTPLMAWMKANKELVGWIAGIAVGLILIGGLFMALGVALAIVSYAFVPLIALISVLKFAWIALATYFTSPKMLLFDAIKAFFLYTFPELIGFAKDTFNDLAHVFDGVGNVFATMWGGIIDAIKAGDFEGAMEIMGVGLQLVWARIINNISQAWLNFKHRINTGAEDVVLGFAEELSTSDGPLSRLLGSWMLGGQNADDVRRLLIEDQMRRRPRVDRTEEVRLQDSLRGLVGTAAARRADAEFEANMSEEERFLRQYAASEGMAPEAFRDQLAQQWNLFSSSTRDANGNLVVREPDIAKALYDFVFGAAGAQPAPPNVDTKLGAPGAFGSFIGAAISGFAGGDWQRQTAENTRDTVATLEQILAALGDTGLTYG